MARLKRIIYLLNMPCNDVAELISRSLDEELPRSERMAVRLHMMYCSMCRRFRKHVLRLRETMKQISQSHEAEELNLETSLSAEARERIRGSFHDR